MSFIRVCLSLSLAALLASVPASATTATKAHRATSAHTKAAHHLSSRRHSHKIHGQQAIDSDRVTQIQQALVREHYLSTEANGEWDATTQAAMQKYQADHGWQTKLVPDSRALKALGLGPDYSAAINAKDVAANSSAPAATPAGTAPAAQTAGFTAASGVNR
ncbi:MAG TPA: peptidoglycan-binding domain-containing protein [Terracidiphilus sp.]|nr:peptidoglycan-binding domain-containing protein [Terracidiphilus sp.]